MPPLLASSSASARGPDDSYSYYENACLGQSGDTRGEGIQLTKTASGYDIRFADYTSAQNPAVSANGRVTGDGIEFEVTGLNEWLKSVQLRFVGTITPDEIRGRFSEGRPHYESNAEGRLKRTDPNRPFPTCQ